MSAALADRVAEHAAGALAAQKTKRRIYLGADPEVAWDALLEVVDKYGLPSTGVAAFVRELAKELSR